MHVYRTVKYTPGFGEPEVTYGPTLAVAHQFAKSQYGSHDWERVCVQLVDVPTHKEGVLTILNNHSSGIFKPMRQWGITPRGGLKEETPEHITA
jgi:hypothetical protein